MYILYKPKCAKSIQLKMSDTAKRILTMLVAGDTYAEIAHKLGISRSGVVKHLDQLLYDNDILTVNDLIIKFIDWEYANGQ